MTFARETLGQHLNFANGKTSPERTEHGPYAVFGSNGEIGRSDEKNSPAETTVIGRVGSYCGSVHYSPEPCWVTDNAIKATAKTSGEGRFWFFALANQNLHDLRAGSGQPLINQTSLKAVELPVPDADGRQKIGALLGSLDDKIEMNRRMNETLEEMARALFRDWFVDFGPTRRQMEGATDPAAIMGQAFPPEKAATLAPLFPAKLGDAGLPEGWRKVSLKSLGNIVTGKTPSTKRPDFYGEDIPFLKIPDMHGKSYVLKTGSMLSALGASSQTKKTVPAGSVSVSCIATPGLVVLNHRDTQTNQQINTVVPNTQSHQYFTFWSCREIASEVMIGGSGGSVFHNMNKTTFENLEVAFPGSDEAALFGKVVEPLQQKILANEEENQTLAEMRDLLLPKLMSGELRLKDVEGAV